jgi:hypothetical protein
MPFRQRKGRSAEVQISKRNGAMLGAIILKILLTE